jgi:hypothetical protein
MQPCLKKKEKKKQGLGCGSSWNLHSCNPSYLGGRDGEDHISRPDKTNSFSKTPSQPINAGHLSAQLGEKHK